MSDVFFHPTALIESTRIGKGTRISAFVHISSGSVIGEDCSLCDHSFLENDVVIGNRVIIRNGVQIWNGTTVEDDVIVGPNAIFANETSPQLESNTKKVVRTIVGKGALIGANSTILHGVIIGVNAIVEAGAVVTRDVPPNAVVTGNPAVITGYASVTHGRKILPQKNNSQIESFSVKQVRLVKLPRIVDLRGSLTFGEYGKHLPFTPVRYFVIFDVPSMEVRGEHAHKNIEQFLVCLKGSCSVVVDNGKDRNEITLGEPDVGLYLPPMIWGIQYKFTSDAILLVLASDVYDADDYIRDYAQYLNLIDKKYQLGYGE